MIAVVGGVGPIDLGDPGEIELAVTAFAHSSGFLLILVRE